MFCAVARSVKTGTAAAAPSVRKNRAADAPPRVRFGDSGVRPRRVIRAEEPRRGTSRRSFTQIHPCLTVTQLRHRERGAIRVAGAQARFDLREGHAAVRGTPSSLV